MNSLSVIMVAPIADWHFPVRIPTRCYVISSPGFAVSPSRSPSRRRSASRRSSACGIKGPLKLPPPPAARGRRAGVRAAAAPTQRRRPRPRRSRPNASRDRVFHRRRRTPRRRRAAVRRSPSASARPATSTRARRSKAAYRDVRRRVRGRAAPRLLRGQGEFQPRGAEPPRAPRQRLRHRLRRRARARASPPAAIPRKVVFSGVGKTAAEMEAALAAGIRCFNVESAAELDALERRRRPRGQASRRSRFRVNPDVDPKTHPYIATGLKESKFGVAFDDALGALPARRRRCRTSRSAASTATSDRRSPTSSACVEAAEKVFELVDRLEADGIALAPRRPGRRPRHPLPRRGDHRSVRLRARRPAGAGIAAAANSLFEPGRFLVGDAGVLLTRVVYLKPGAGRDFAIVDAAMNDLLRPALYDAWHRGRAGAPARRAGAPLADRRAGVRERAISSRATACSRSPTGDLLAVRARGRVRRSR